jgi:hypothetical protein
MPDDPKPTDPKPDDLKGNDWEDLSQVQEPTDEDEERIRRKLEDDMRRKGLLPDPIPRPSALPPQPCPQGANGKHQWRHTGNYLHPTTKQPMNRFVCNHCQTQTSAPMGHQPPP